MKRVASYSVYVCKIMDGPLAIYRIRQNIRGGKLSRFSWILAKCESFTIESFPSSQYCVKYCVVRVLLYPHFF